MEFHVDSTVYSGIPENKKDRLPVEQRTYELLESLGISFARLDHDAAYTIDACAAVDQLLGIHMCKKPFSLQRAENKILSSAYARS